MKSGIHTLQIYPRVYRYMLRVKPRATLGLIFITVLIQKTDKQWKVCCGCLEKLALGNFRGSSDFPEGPSPEGKSDDCFYHTGVLLLPTLIARYVFLQIQESWFIVVLDTNR